MGKRVKECKCKQCGTWCQGFESPLGIYCADCYKKIFGEWPWEAADWDED